MYLPANNKIEASSSGYVIKQKSSKRKFLNNNNNNNNQIDDKKITSSDLSSFSSSSKASSVFKQKKQDQQLQEYYSLLKAQTQAHHHKKSKERDLNFEMYNSSRPIASSAIPLRSNNNINRSLKCSFENSDFVYDCNDTLRHTKKKLEWLNRSPLINPIDDYNRFVRPIYYTNNCIHTYGAPNNCCCQTWSSCNTHCHSHSSCGSYHHGHNSCACGHGNNMMMVPAQNYYHQQHQHQEQYYPKVEHQRSTSRNSNILYMQTDGTLALSAIPIEKPNSINYKYNRMQRMQPMKPVMIPTVPIPTKPKIITIKNKTQYATAKKTDIDMFNQSNGFDNSIRSDLRFSTQMAFNDNSQQNLKSNGVKTRSSKVEKVFDSVKQHYYETQLDDDLKFLEDFNRLESPKAVSKNKANSRISKTISTASYPANSTQSVKIEKTIIDGSLVDIKDNKSTQTTKETVVDTNLKQTDSSSSLLKRFSRNEILKCNDSLSSLDDFIRSPYNYYKSQDLERFNSDYSSDTISVGSIDKRAVINANNLNELLKANKTNEAPNFKLMPKSYVGKCGNNAKFKCSFTGYPQPTVTWYFNKINLNKLNMPHKYKIYSKKNGSFYLKVFNLKSYDVGKITCYIENCMGNAEACANLIVLNNQDSNLTTQSNKLIARNEESPVIFNENILYKFDNFIGSNNKNENHNSNQPLLTYRQNNGIDNQIDYLFQNNNNNNNNNSLVQHTTAVHKYLNTLDNLNISIKYATFNKEDEIEYYIKNRINVHINDRVTVTCKKEHYDLCYWIHPKGFLIKNSERFQIESDKNTYKLDILSIQLDDAGIYECIKLSDNQERKVRCCILVKEN